MKRDSEHGDCEMHSVPPARTFTRCAAIRFFRGAIFAVAVSEPDPNPFEDRKQRPELDPLV